jgi:hypothetical protein
MGAKIRLGLFLLASLLLHVALLVLPVREPRAGGVAGRFASTPALQVRLSSPVDEEAHVLPELVHSVRSHLDQGRARETEGEEKELASGFPAVFDYQAPEIVSEMPRMISDLKASGFVIIRLAIDNAGQVESADIVYSNMPFEVSGKLLLLFSQARFRPAHNGGKAVADSILLQVDVN